MLTRRFNAKKSSMQTVQASKKTSFNSRFTLRSVVAATLLAAGASAFAQASQSPFYVGGSLGASMIDGNYAGQVQAAGSPLPGYTFHSAKRNGDNEFAGRIYGGYRLHPNVAVELGYSNFGSQDVTYRLNKSTELVPANSPYISHGRNKLDGFTLDVVGTLPVNSQFSINGRAGLMASTLRYSETIANPVVVGGVYGVETVNYSAPREHQTRFHWGAGGSYQLNPKLALTLDYQRVQGVGNTFSWTGSGNGKLNYSLLSAGARFSF
jgi:OmpA-OmpF porin, OOP family